MPEYRLYFIGPSGRFAGVQELDCPDDEAAIETARRYVDGRAMELWEQARKVRAFETADASGRGSGDGD